MQFPRPTPLIEDLRNALSADFASIDPLKTGGQALLYKGRRIRTEKGIATDEPVAIKLYLDPNEDARIEKEVQAAREAKCDTLVKFLVSGRVNIKQGNYILDTQAPCGG